MTSDTRRESDHGRETRGEVLRRREIDARTSEVAQALSAKEVRTGPADAGKRSPESLPRLTAREEMARLDRIAERSSMRFTRDFDPARQRQLEDVEIRTSPISFLDRQDHAGLDRGTVRLVRHSLEAHGIASATDLQANGLADTWDIFDGQAHSE